MAIYAIVNNATGDVENITEWDGVSEWTPPEGTSAILADENAAIGGTYANGVFTPPPIPEPTQEELDRQAATEALITKLRNYFADSFTEEELDRFISNMVGG